jgi:mono/diheme cytochrome c family protein
MDFENKKMQYLSGLDAENQQITQVFAKMQLLIFAAQISKQHQTHCIMKKIIVFTLFAACLFACGKSGKQEPAAGTTTKPGIDGEKIYKTYCVTCHGLYGDMGGSGAFDLTKATLSVEERIQVITNGRNAMTPFKELLTEEKIRAVAEYTMKLKKN